MKTRYPSQQEVQQQIKPVLDQIRKDSDYAEYEAPSTPPIDYRSVVGEKRTKSTPPASQPQPQLFEDHFRLLTDIHEHPEGGVAKRYRRLGGSVQNWRDRLRELIDAGAITIEQLATEKNAPGKKKPGVKPDIASLTSLGRQWLATHEREESQAKSKSQS